MELYAVVRRDTRQGPSSRARQERYRVGYRTVHAELDSGIAVCLAIRWRRPSRLDRYKSNVDSWLGEDLSVHRKQRYTSKRLRHWSTGPSRSSEASRASLASFCWGQSPPQVLGRAGDGDRTPKASSANGRRNCPRGRLPRGQSRSSRLARKVSGGIGHQTAGGISHSFAFHSSVIRSMSALYSIQLPHGSRM